MLLEIRGKRARTMARHRLEAERMYLELQQLRTGTRILRCDILIATKTRVPVKLMQRKVHHHYIGL